MKIVKSYLLILISALLIIGLISCSSRFTPRKNDTDSFEKAELKELSSDNGNATTPPNNIFERVASKTYEGSGYANTFSSDGKTITHVENGKTDTYVYSNESNGIAVYYNESGESLIRWDKKDGRLYIYNTIPADGKLANITIKINLLEVVKE